MSQLQYIRSLWPTGLLFYPHELAHWIVVRIWTREAKISPTNAEFLDGFLTVPAAQIEGPIPVNLPLYLIRTAALAPLILMFSLTLMLAPRVDLVFQSPEYFLVTFTILVIGAPSSHDINTLFKAEKTREIGGFGTDYVDISEVDIPLKITLIWLVIIVLWAGFVMISFALF